MFLRHLPGGWRCRRIPDETRKPEVGGAMSTNRFQNFLLRRLAEFAPLFVGAGLCAAPLTWFPGAALNEPRSSAATVVTPSGKIMIFGGNPIGSTNVLVYGGTDAQTLNGARVA